MEVVNVHVGAQTASLSACFLSSLSYVTINHENVSFVVDIKFISFLCEMFSFHRGEYEDSFFVWNAVSCSPNKITDVSKKNILPPFSYTRSICSVVRKTHNVAFNPLKPELNPICYLLALLGAHHFLHVSRIRVKLLNFRLLMSYIYIQGGTGGMCQASGGCSLC